MESIQLSVLMTLHVAAVGLTLGKRASLPQDCIICMDQLSNASGYETQSTEEGPSVLPDTVGKFIKCGHTLHMLCMLAMYNNGTKVPMRTLKPSMLSSKTPDSMDKSCNLPMQNRNTPIRAAVDLLLKVIPKSPFTYKRTRMNV